MENRGEVILYQPDNEVKLEVRLEDETVWLTQEQIAILFGTKRPAITKHLNNIYNSGELDRENTCSILEHMGNDGKQKYVTKFYNLDAILSVGYRVNSRNAALFRRWANSVLKEYLLKGHVINCRLEQIDTRLKKHERQIEYLTDKVDFFVRTSLPPAEGIFHDGQIFDAYKFATDLIRSAKKSILLIDKYVDESVLLMLSKRNAGVKADIYTQSISGQLRLDLEKHNSQYPQIGIHTCKKSHDRFLIIDGTEVWHIGASLNFIPIWAIFPIFGTGNFTFMKNRRETCSQDTKARMTEQHPLEPFFPGGARILMLGSFPPKKERWSMDFFYPNFNNDMWRIIGLIFFGDKSHFEMAARTADSPDGKASGNGTTAAKRFDREKIAGFCAEKGIALYDTAAEVRRLKDNASDKFLEIVTPTDLSTLLEKIPECTAIVTTGEKAAEATAAYFGCKAPTTGKCIEIIMDGSDSSKGQEDPANGKCPCNARHLMFWRMPSSSRAYPLSLEKKAEAYRNMFISAGIL